MTWGEHKALQLLKAPAPDDFPDYDMAADAAVSSRLAASGARCSARKALTSLSVTGDLPPNALPPDASIIVVCRAP